MLSCGTVFHPSVHSFIHAIDAITIFFLIIRGGASSRRVTEADMINARIEAESPDMKTTRQLGNVKVRLKSLGTDRDRRRYWLLARGEVRLLVGMFFFPSAPV